MKVIIISPYFGKLPDTFELWLESCSYNENFTFVVFTDDDRSFTLPNNVMLNKCSLADFKNIVQEKFDFPISLETPYKLCDYKVAYGYIFSDLVKAYDYWGFCDLDMIFGDLNQFIPDNNKYDRINNFAHLSLYKNTDFINTLFMEKICDIDYKDIFSSPVHFGFDEIGEYGIAKIMQHKSLNTYPLEHNIADINCLQDNMGIYNHRQDKMREIVDKESVFSFEKGHIYGWHLRKDNIIQREYVYIHFQKRKMRKLIDSFPCEKYIIANHTIEPFYSPNAATIKKCNGRNYTLNTIKIIIKSRVKRFKRNSELRRIRRFSHAKNQRT